MKKLAALLFLILNFTAFPQRGQELYFQPEFAGGAPASKVFEEINYIPLQTTKKSLFGRIKKLIVQDDYYIIWDDDTNPICFFDKTGTFIKKYRPPKCIIQSIQLNKNKNALFISGKNKHYNFSQTEIEKMMEDHTNNSFARFAWSGYYDLNDVRKKQVQELKGFSISLVSPTIFNNGQWAFSYVAANKKWSNDTAYEVNVYNDQTITRQYFPYSKMADKVYYQSSRASFYPTPDSVILLFTHPYQYSIYQLTKDTTSVLYKLILPLEISLPQSFFSGTFKTKNDVQQFKMQNRSLVWGIYDLYRLKHYLFFSLDYDRNRRERDFLYDESTKRFYSTSKIKEDSANCYLPVLPYGVQYADENYLYSSVSSAALISNMATYKNMEPKYSSVLEKFFQQITAQYNPIIIQLKPKNKID